MRQWTRAPSIWICFIYRLNVFPIHTPPLRDCPEDILALSSISSTVTLETPAGRFETSSEKRWIGCVLTMGNIRELQNVV
jgi:transcriptional regulator with GAF, ATPase, and Fis domain